MKNLIWTIVIVAVLGGGWYTIKNKSESSSQTIKIGVATLLTGDYAVLGENIVNAAKLAVEDVNKSGGINGRKFEIVIQDSGVDSKSGLSAVQKLINADQIKYIIGGMSSNGTLAVAPLANQHEVIVLTPVTGGKNVDEAGDFIFRIANSDILAGRDLANVMVEMGYKNVGVVSATTEYTLDIKNTFEKVVKDNGGTVVVSEEFRSGTTDYRTLVAKVREAKPQALLVLSQLGTDAAQFIKQAREAGYDVPLFTDFTLATNSGVKEILGSLDGIYFADPYYELGNSATKAFFERYQDVYGKSSAIPFHAASTYDGIMLFADALRAEGDDSEKVQQWLITQVKNYRGLMGTYSLDSSGNSDLGFTVRVIKNDQPVEVK